MKERYHLFQKWIKEHKEEYRGNRSGDLQDAYLEKVKEGIPSFTGWQPFWCCSCFSGITDSPLI